MTESRKPIADLWPRHYAAEIAALPTRQERTAALTKVPEVYREWVRCLVKMTFNRRREVR